MLIHDLDYSEKIYSESPVSGGKTVSYCYTQVQQCTATSNGKGVTCKTISTDFQSGNGKVPSLESINKYIAQVEKSVRAGSLAHLLSDLF